MWNNATTGHAIGPIWHNILIQSIAEKMLISWEVTLHNCYHVFIYRKIKTDKFPSHYWNPPFPQPKFDQQGAFDNPLFHSCQKSLLHIVNITSSCQNDWLHWKWSITMNKPNSFYFTQYSWDLIRSFANTDTIISTIFLVQA